jgi:hypothetical protein
LHPPRTLSNFCFVSWPSHDVIDRSAIGADSRTGAEHAFGLVAPSAALAFGVVHGECAGGTTPARTDVFVT